MFTFIQRVEWSCKAETLSKCQAITKAEQLEVYATSLNQTRDMTAYTLYHFTEGHLISPSIEDCLLLLHQSDGFLIEESDGDKTLILKNSTNFYDVYFLCNKIALIELDNTLKGLTMFNAAFL